MFTGSGSLFFILLFCNILHMACCMAMVFILLKMCLMFCLAILNFAFIVFINGMCVGALAFAVIIISGSTFHPILVTLP